jgi:prepilin-type N-terminal cleavage/methylation domain-containing protein
LPTHRSTAAQRASAAFTLLEMVVVLFIIAVFAGVAAFSFTGLTEQEALRKPAAELQFLAREAVRRAGMTEQPQFIVFETNAFSMNYRGDPAAVTASRDERRWVRRTQGPENMNILLKRWGSKDWRPASGQRWVVQGGGLCEPLEVRMELGPNWIEMQFHPLTGAVASQEFHLTGS